MDTEFQRRVTVEAAAHACLAVGASRAYPPVLETLADIVKHYVATLGAHAHAVSEHGGRTDVNVLDILAAMKQMGPEAVRYVYRTSCLESIQCSCILNRVFELEWFR